MERGRIYWASRAAGDRRLSEVYWCPSAIPPSSLSLKAGLASGRRCHGHPEIPALPPLPHGCGSVPWPPPLAPGHLSIPPSGRFSDPWQRTLFKSVSLATSSQRWACSLRQGQPGSPKSPWPGWAFQCVTYSNPTVAPPSRPPSWRPPSSSVPFYAARGDPAHMSASVSSNTPRKTPAHWAHNVSGVPGSQVPRPGSRRVQTLGEPPPLGRGVWRRSPGVGWGHADDTRLRRGDRGGTCRRAETPMGWAGGDRRAGMAAAAGAGWARPARRWEGSAEEVAGGGPPSLVFCSAGAGQVLAASGSAPSRARTQAIPCRAF